MRLLPLFQVLFNDIGRLIRPVLEDSDHRYRMGGGAHDSSLLLSRCMVEV
jgi:hypothetical protein